MITKNKTIEQKDILFERSENKYKNDIESKNSVINELN